MYSKNNLEEYLHPATESPYEVTINLIKCTIWDFAGPIFTNRVYFVQHENNLALSTILVGGILRTFSVE